jgi:prepilin signal peptidase PulO-like enzyme (type II secretory pathway)
MIATFASFYGSYFHLEQEINIELGLYLIIAINLILIALIDNHGYLTPNKLLYSLSSLVTILLLYQNNLNPNAVISNIGSAFLFMGFSFILFLAANFGDEAESFSINNVKLSFIIGLLLGFSGFITFIILTGIAGVIYGNFWKKLFGSNSFPFTPTICISAFTCLLYAESLSVENFFEQLSYIGINL